MTARSCKLRSSNVKLAAAAMLALLPAPLFAQTAATTPKLTMQGQAEQSRTPIVRDPLGRPCLDVEAAARAEAVNPAMVDHVVSLKNNCLKLITAKVCYFNSDRCKDVVLQAYKRVDVSLGTMRGVTTFRYSITQK